MFTIVDSLEGNIRGSLQSLGNNVVYIQKWPWSFGPDYPWWKYINRPTPQYHELDEIAKQSKTTEALAYRLGGRRTLKYKSNAVENAVVAGVSYEFYKIKNFDLSVGRYFTRNETDAGYHVAVIGSEKWHFLLGFVGKCGCCCGLHSRNHTPDQRPVPLHVRQTIPPIHGAYRPKKAWLLNHEKSARESCFKSTQNP